MAKLFILAVVAGFVALASSCRSINTLIDYTVGTYLKTACTLTIKADYQDAERICRQLKMELMIVDQEQTYLNFQSAMQHDFPAGTTWINGRKDSSDTWSAWSSTQTKVPVLPALLGDQSASPVMDHSNCLAYSDEGGIYRPVPTTCDSIVDRFTCEYTVQPVVNTDACWNKQDLFDTTGTTLLRSACIVATLSNYYEAEEYCKNKGMTLFNLDSSEVEVALKAYTNQAIPGNQLWISGQTITVEGTTIWVTYDPILHNLFEFPDWYNDGVIDGSTSGDCLSFADNGGNYFAKGDDCSAKRSFFICQY